MADYTDSGVLFRNDRKERDNQPDYTGKINVGGTEKRLAAWIKEGQNGKYMSLKVSDPQERESAPQQSTSEPSGGGRGDLDDSVPFGPEWR